MINGYLSVGGPMCAQSISVLNIITFTDYSSANITILCASLASVQTMVQIFYVCAHFVVSAFIKAKDRNCLN